MEGFIEKHEKRCADRNGGRDAGGWLFPAASDYRFFRWIGLILRKMKGKMLAHSGNRSFVQMEDSSLFNTDYADMAAALLAAGAEFMLVGGFAVSIHGYPRTTFDIDFWVRPTPENAPKVLAALRAFGSPLQGVTASDFDHPDMVLQIGVAPRRIDILTSIDGVTWEEASPRAIRREIGGLSVPVLGIGDLIRNKRATGRPKDAADAAALEQIAGERP